MGDFTVIKNADDATPLVPSYVRTTVFRASAGSMLFASVVATAGALTAETETGRFECSVAAAINLVAVWHYTKMLEIRSSKRSSQETEMAIDAVRLSDWMVTLPPLIIEVHALIDGHFAWFAPPVSALLLALVVALGAFVRLGTDELAPSPTKRLGGCGWDMVVRIVGFVMFVVAFALLIIVLLNAFLDLPSLASNGGWPWAFAFPWLAYGVVAAIGIAWRNIWPGYSEGVSLFKDAAYGTLDVWSKAIFALFIASKSLGQNEKFFNFV